MKRNNMVWFSFWVLSCLSFAGTALAFPVPTATSARQSLVVRHPRSLFRPMELSPKRQHGVNTNGFIRLASAVSNETDVLLDDKLVQEQDDEASSSTITQQGHSSYPPTPTFRECMAFALPALGIYICSPLMSLIDCAFIGRGSSVVELAALGPASSISDSAPLPLLFLSIAATNLIAQSNANKDKDATAQVSRTALGMGTVCGTVLAVILYLTAQPLSVLYCGGAQAAAAQRLAPACCTYVSIRALALPAVVVTTIAQAICIGTKDTRTPMVSVAVAAILNLLGDFVLIKRLNWGIAGAAWATAMSQFISAGLLVRNLQRRGFLKASSAKAAGNSDKDGSTLSTMRQLVSFIPFLFVMAVKIGWHNSCSATAASLGGVPAAAHTAVLSVAMVCMVLGDVGSSLSQAFLPAFLRSKPRSKNSESMQSAKTDVVFDLDAAMPTIRQLLKCTLSISASVMALAFFTIGFFGGQISRDAAVVAEMRRILPWIVATLSFHGSAVTLEGLLLSRKKFRNLTACYIVLAVTVAAFQFATRRFHLGLAGVWGCYLWFCSSRVVTFSALGGLLRPEKWLERLRRIRIVRFVKGETA